MSCILCSEVKELSELLQYGTESGQLSQVFRNWLGSAAVLFNVTRSSPSRSAAIGLGEEEVSVYYPSQHVHPVAYMYANRGILHFNVK